MAARDPREPHAAHACPRLLVGRSKKTRASRHWELCDEPRPNDAAAHLAYAVPYGSPGSSISVSAGLRCHVACRSAPRRAGVIQRCGLYLGGMDMEGTDVWLRYPVDLRPDSVSRREGRCTWHGDRESPCGEEPVVVVQDRAGRRWATCLRGARAVAADRGVPLPSYLAE